MVYKYEKERLKQILQNIKGKRIYLIYDKIDEDVLYL